MKKLFGKALAMAVMMSVFAGGQVYADESFSGTVVINGSNPITLNSNAGIYPDPSITIGKTDSDNVRINNLGLECYNGNSLWATVNINGLTTISNTNRSEVDHTGIKIYKNGDYENPFMKFDVYGVDVGNNVIKNVKAGTNDTDAVNFSQIKAVDGNYVKADKTVAQNFTALDDQVKTNAGDIAALKTDKADQTALDDEVKAREQGDDKLQKQINAISGGSSAGLNELNNKINQTNDRVDRVGATAAALAGIHYQPMAKGQSQVAVGMGGYKGKKATALGLAYQISDRISGSVAGAANGSEHMFNVGFNYLFGQHSDKDIAQCAAVPGSVSLKEAELQSEVDSLKADNASMKAHIAKQDARMAQLEAMVKALATK